MIKNDITILIFGSILSAIGFLIWGFNCKDEQKKNGIIGGVILCFLILLFLSILLFSKLV